MAQTSKTYRGQGRNKDRDHIGCGCFLCTGKDRGNQYVVDKEQAKREMKQIIDNFVLDLVICYDVRCPDCMSSNTGGSYCYNCNNLMW